MDSGASVNSQTESGDTPVHIGIKNVCFKFVLAMLSKAFHPNTQNNKGTTCLMLVVTNYDLFKQLLDIGTDPTIQDHEGNTVLHHLCSTSFETKKEKEMIELLVKSGSTVNGLNLEGYTPLNRMIAEKKKLIVEDVVYLLSLKADPNICLEGCHSPLMNSLLRWNLDVAYYLLNAGGDVKHDGKSGLTALHVILNLQLPHAERPMKYFCYIDSNKEQDGYAAERIDMIQKLLEAGSDVNKRDCEGNTGLNFCLKTLYKGGKDEFIPVVRILLKAGADPNISDISGKRPLEIVISTSPRKYRNETEIRKLAEMLIIYGAKFNDYKKGEDSVLHLAVSKELKSVVYLLVTKGADVNHQGKYQQTPLHRYFSLANEYKPADVPVLQRMSEELKSPEIVDILLSSTKDPNIEDENKDSPLNLACACSSKNENDLSKLLKAGANPLHKGKENVDAFEKCIALENFPALEILLKEKGSNHITDLHFSAFWNVFHIYDDELYERVVFLMLKTNENININKENLTGNTPLTYFCHRNGTEVVRKLLEKGANVNVITTTGLNALHSLLDSPDVAPKLDTISVVLASNPNTEVKDSSGKTVLQRAIHKYQKCYYTNTSSFTNKCLATLMGHLLNSGAKCEKSELTSLLLIASERQQYLLMKELVKRGADLSVKKWERGILHNCWNNHFISEDNLPKLLAECIVYLKFHQEFGGSLTEVFDDCTPLLSYLKSDSFKKSNKCKERSDEVVALLACDKEIVCKYDRRLLSAIHIAASSGRLSTMKILVEKGANLFSKGREENSCLHFCLSSEENSIEDMVSYLLENGISANDMNLSNETPLYLILKNAKYHSEDEVSSIVKLLIKYGGNPNPGNVEKNPFVKAIRTLNVRSVLILLKNGAKVNCLQDGTSALHIMYDQSQSALFQDKCYEEKISCLQQLLLTKQLDINAKHTYEETVLHLAVKALCNRRTPNGAIRLIQELVEHGVDINATNKIGQTAFSLSCDFLSYDNECFAVSKYLLENGSNPNKGSPLNCLFKQWHYEGNYRLKELILQLLSYGANPNDGIFKPTCLPNQIIAINKGELRIVNTLLERGANPNVSDFNGTSLFHACKLGSENAKKVMPLLLQYGCSINGGQQGEPHSSYRRHPLFKLVEKITEDHEYVEIERKGKEMIAKVDLRLFNLLLCGGCDLSFPLRSGCNGNSILASLTKAGYFKAAETLIRCGYNFKDDEIFGKINLTNLDVTTVRTKQRRYRRANYEKAVEEFQEMLTRNQEHATLFSLSRKAIREHLVFVHNGSDIEILIKLLPLPEKIKKYLTYREYTQDFEEIKLQEETRSEDTNTNIRYTGPGVDSSLYDYQYDDFVVDDYRDDSDDSPLSYYDDFDDYMYDTDTFDFI